jgi:prevent-host-death family protein
MTVSIYEAKTNLSKLIAKVELTGGEIVIRRHNMPVAKLVPFRPSVEPRRLGEWKGQVVIADDFDTLPAEIAAAFDGANP